MYALKSCVYPVQLRKVKFVQSIHECILVLRFRVLIEILKPDKPDATVSLKGLEYIDVPALAKRDYKISFFTYREGQYNTKV